MVISMKSSLLLLLWGVFYVFPLAALSSTTPENKVPTTGNHDNLTTQQQLNGANVQSEAQTPPTQTPARAGVAATEETEKATATLSGSGDKTSGFSATATTGKSGGWLLSRSAAATTTEAKPTHKTNVSKTGEQLHQQSSTYRAAPSEASTSAVSLATRAPTTKPASTTKPEDTSKLHPTNSSDDSVQSTVSTLGQGVPSGPASTPVAANTTSGGVPAMPRYTSQPVSTPISSTFTSARRTTEGSATKPPSTISTNTTTNSTSPANIVIPDGPKTTPSTISSNTTANTTSTANNVIPDGPKTTPSTISSNTTANTTSTANIVIPDGPKTPLSTISPNTTTNTTSPANIVIPDGPKTTPSTISSDTTTNSTSPAKTTIPDGPKTPPSTTSSNTTTNSTSPAGVLIPLGPKKLPTQPTKSPATIPNRPPSTDPQPCSSRGVVKTCLIAIASLAGLATIFMVTTIILCTKLSRRKYRVRKPQEDTEMMCISSLMPERNYNYSRQRNLVTNGVLVMHTPGDSDEEGGDNLTLSSFLPENDRLV